MSPRFRAPLVLLLVACLAAAGCHPTQPIYWGNDKDLTYFLDRANDIAHPDLEEAVLAEVTNSGEPITVDRPDFDDFWDLTLEDVVSISLNNSKVIRGYGTPNLSGVIVAPGVDSLSTQPAGAGSVYDVAVQETEPGNLTHLNQPSTPGVIPSASSLETQQGVEAALAEFDTNFTSSLFFSGTDRPQNINPALAQLIGRPLALIQNDAAFTAELSKKAATGTVLFFRNTTDYTRNNNPPNAQPLSSVYTTAFEMEVRQPFLRGAGSLVNRMPVVIARIGTDQQLAALEANLQNMLCNVEIRYWNLYCAYRTYETAIEGRDAVLASWYELAEKIKAGGTRDTRREQLSQTIEQYYLFQGEVERAFSELVDAENDLRWLMGLASTDGRLIRPSDEPVDAKVDFEWHSLQDDAMVFRPLLRSERWEVKKRELQLAYARNTLLPRVNGVALYRWLGLGDHLVQTPGTGIAFPNAGSNAWENMMFGNHQEFQLGIEGGLTIGFRRELANVRNAQLELVRERSRLEDMELDIVRELSTAYRALETNYRLAQDNYNRWSAAEAEVGVRQDKYEAGVESASLEFVLDAQRRRANARVDYYRSLCEYNKVIALIHRRKGTALAYCGVHFGEGPWPKKAYFDAVGNGRRRSASHHLNYGWTRPGVISRDSLQGGVPSPGEHLYDEYHGEHIEGIVPGSTRITEGSLNHEAFEQIDTPAPTPASPQPGSKPDEASPSGPGPIPGATSAAKRPNSSRPLVSIRPQTPNASPQVKLTNYVEEASAGNAAQPAAKVAAKPAPAAPKTTSKPSSNPLR